MANYFEDQLKQQQEQLYADAVRAAEESATDYTNLWDSVSEDNYRRRTDRDYANRRAEEELKRAQYQSAIMDENFELESRDRVQKLVEQGIEDPNQLLRIIKSDPILSKRYPTDGSVIDAIHDIQNRVQSAKDPYRALEGKEVVGDQGFFGNMWQSAKSTLAGTVGGLIYDTQRNNELLKLGNMPLKQLQGIDKKIEARDEITRKLKEAQNDLFSYDPVVKSKAMNDIAYYQNALKNLGLTPEEQKVFDMYGKDYYQTKANIDELHRSKNTLWGANEITTDQAQRLVKNAQRDNFYKLTGTEPTFYDSFINGIKDSGSNLGEELGMVMGFAIPLMVGGPLGIALKGASLLSEAATTSADLMEEYINKHGDLPDQKAISAMMHGLGVAAVDQFGTYGLVKGVKGARGVWRGVGLSESDRLAEQFARQTSKELKALSAGLDPHSRAAAATAIIQSNSTKYMQSLSDAIKSNSKVSKSVDVLQKSNDTGILNKIKNATSVPKNIQRIKEGNEWLHTKLGTGAQDIAKAGVSLAGENVGSTAIRQNYDDTWDANELAESAGQGIMTGSAFHAANALPGAGIRKASNAYQDYKTKKAKGLDSDSTFNKFLKNLDTVSPTQASQVLTAYKDQHDKSFDKYIKPLQDANKAIEGNNKLRENGLEIKDGVAFIGDKFTGVVPRKELQRVADTYNKNAKALSEFQTKYGDRSKLIEDKLTEIAKGSLKKNQKSNSAELDTETERLVNDVILNGSVEDAVSLVKDYQQVNDAVAKGMVDEARKRASTSQSEFKNTLSKDQQKLFENLKGMVSYTDLYDIRDNENFIKAINTGEASEVASAIDSSELSKPRKNQLKRLLNQTTLDNLGRDSTARNDTTNISTMDKTTRRMASKALKVKPQKLEDIKTTDDIKNYVYNKLFNNTENVDNDTIIASALKDITDSSLDQGIKDLINSDLRTNIGEELTKGLEDSIQYNNAVKSNRAKVYASKEEAQKALKDYHDKAKDYFYVSELYNPVTGQNDYYIKNNVSDIKNKIDALSSKVARNSELSADGFFNDLKDIVDTVTKGLSNKDTAEYTKWLDTKRDEYDKAIEGVTDTGKINKIKSNVLNQFRNLTEGRISENILKIDTEALSKSKTKIHAYTTSEKEKAITRKQLKLYQKNIEEEQEAASDISEGLKGITPNQMHNFMYTAIDNLLNGNPIHESDFARINDIYKYFASQIQNYENADTLDTLKQYLTIVNADKANLIQNTANPTKFTSATGSIWDNERERRDLLNRLKARYDGIPVNARTFNYRVVPDGLYQESNAYLDLVERIRLEEIVNSIGELNRHLSTNTTIRTNIENILNRLNSTTYEYKDTKTGALVTESYLVYLGKLYGDADHKYVENGRLIKEVTAANYLPLLLKGLASNEATMRIVLGLQAGVATRPENLANKNIVQPSSLDDPTYGIIPWTDIIPNASSRMDIQSKVAEFSRLFGSNFAPIVTHLIYSGHGTLHNTLKVMSNTQMPYTFGLSDTIINTSTADLINYIRSSAFPTMKGETREVSDRIIRLYNNIVNAYGNYLRTNPTGNPVGFMATYGITIDGRQASVFNREFGKILKYSIREALRYNLVDYVSGHTNVNELFQANSEFNNYVKAMETVSTLSDNVNPYTRFEAEMDASVTSSDLPRLVRAIQQSDVHDTPLRTILNGSNDATSTRAASDGSYRTRSTVSFSDDEITKITSTLPNSNDATVDDIDINNLTISKDEQDRVARSLARFINNRQINNRVARPNVTNTNGIRINSANFNTTDTYNNILMSDYYKYVEPRSIRRRVSPILLDDLDAQLASSNVTNVTAIMDLVDELAKEGHKFISCENAADKLLAYNYVQAKPTYSKGMRRGMALVGISSLSTVSTGQSDEWLNTQVSNGRLSSNAAGKMKSDRLIDYQTFAETLGNKSKVLLPIRFNSNSPATLDNDITLGLGVRTLNMLESSKKIEKVYLNRDTGATTTTQPKDIDSGKWVRTLRLTTDGKKLIKTVSDNNSYGVGEHVIDTLLGDYKDDDVIIDNHNTGGRNGYADEQQRRQDKYNAEFTPDSETETNTINVNNVDYRITINRDNNLGYVECLSTTNSNVFNGRSTYYFIKDQVIKPGERNNYIALPDLVEEAYKSSIDYKFDETSWNNSINPLIDKIIARARAQGIPETEEYLVMTPDELKMFGMDDPSKQNSYLKTNVFNKNSSIWRQVIQFRDDLAHGRITSGSTLYYNVINTHNNRFYVKSNHVNYREFKLFRELFKPDDSFHKTNNYNLDAATVSANKSILYGFVLHNLGLPVDKMDMANITRVGEELKTYLDTRGNELTQYVQDYINTVRNPNASNDAHIKHLAKIKKFFADSNIIFDKVPIATGEKTPIKIAVNLHNAELMTRLPSLLQAISQGEPIQNFHYVMEVDGLNNGTSIHYAQSGLFGDNTPLSIDKLTSVGVFQGVNINNNGSVVFDDYITAAYQGALDAYLQSAAVAESKSKAQQYRDLLREQAKDDYNLQDCIVVLGLTLGYDASNYNAVLSKLTDRDIIKYVSMPNSYGAGAVALTNYIYENIVKNFSEVIANTISDISLTKSDDVNKAYNKINGIYMRLNELNSKVKGSKLMLKDSHFKSISYEDAISGINDADGKLSFMQEYLPSISESKGLDVAFSSGIVKHILTGAAAVTGEANTKKQIYGEAIEAISELYVASVQELLDSPKFKGRDPQNFTKRDIDELSETVCSKFAIGENRQRLDVLKQAIMPALTLAFKNKVQGFTEDGIYSVARSTDFLSKEPNVTAFSPESVHTIDKDTIGRAGAELRDIIGNFVGIHDAAIVDFNQVLRVGESLNKNWFESTLHSYDLPLSMAYTLEMETNRLKNSKYYPLGAANKANRAINKLRNFAAIQITAKLRMLQQAKQTPLTIKQYAFSDDAYVIDSNLADTYIKQIQDRSKASNYKPIMLNNFMDYVHNQGHNTAYKALKNLDDYIVLQYGEAGLAQFLSDLSTPNTLAYNHISDSNVRADLIRLGNTYTTQQQKLTDANDIINAYFNSLAARNVGLESNPNLNTSTTNGLASFLDNYTALAEKAGLFIGKQGTSVTGDNTFRTNYILENISKIMGLSGDNKQYLNISALVAMTTSSNISSVDLTTLSSYMQDIDKSPLNVQPYDANANTVVTDFDDVPLKDFLSNVLREARRRELGSTQNLKLNDYISSIMREFADKYIETIIKRSELVKDNKNPVQVVFKCDSAIDRIVMSRLTERLNNGQLKGFTVSVVPNINNIKSITVDKNTHYYDTLLRNQSNHVPATVLNQSYNKKLAHRNYIYQNQFNSFGLVNKVNTNKSFNVSYNDNTNMPISKPSLNCDSCEMYVADYFGNIQRAVYDGVITNDLLTSYDSYDANGYQTHQSDIKTYSNATIDDLNREIYNFSDIVVDTSPLSRDIYSNSVNLNTQDIMDMSNDTNLVFGIDSSGNIIDSKIKNGILNSYPEFNTALGKVRELLKHDAEFLAQNTNIDRDSLYPPIQVTVFINGIKLNLHFFVNEDYRISLDELFNPTNGMVQRNTDSQYKNQFIIRNDATNASDYFSDTVISNQQSINNPDSLQNNFFRDMEELYNKTPASLRSTTYVDIPKPLRSSSKPLSEKARAINTLKMYSLLSSTNGCHIFGSSTNDYCFSTDSNKKPYIYDFGSVAAGTVSVGTTSSSFKNAIQNGVNHVQDTIRNLIEGHAYTIDKDRDLLSRYTRATFLDTSCEDLENTFNSLAAQDTANQVNPKEISVCREIFDELKNLNINIRTAVRRNASSRNGYAAVLDQDPKNDKKPTGYVYIETASEGSNVTTFTHELTHIPLTYLYRDPKANHMAVEMYNYIADNLNMSDFDCSKERAQEIYDYLFKDKRTADPYIECLNYLLTERSFIRAVDNMNKRLNFKKAFDSRCKSILNRFLDKISNNMVKPSDDFHDVALDILKRSIDLTNEYSRRAEKPELGYLADSTHPIAKMNAAFAEGLAKLTEKIKPFTSKIYNTQLQLMGIQTVHNILSPQENNDEILEVMPELTNLVGHVAGIRGSVANEFKQSFEGVSKDNYEYVKLRYAAKEEVDKEREVASAAVNKLVDGITKEIPTKILSNMSSAMLKVDVSSLLNDRALNDAQSRSNAKQYLKKTLLDSDYRQNQIENIERNLKKYNNGLFFINAAKGLANKLVYGVNTSGIGYTNAYEIANLCGSSAATRENSTVENLLDKYITLRAMQLYVDKHDTSVYDYLGENINTAFDLSLIHNQIKSLEKDRVYPDSLHKNHIPKGELHGSTRENSYALVPESEVKAYEWSGYKKIREANLDSFYKTIADEPYYIMEGKWLPNAPYVSGIPVLSDVFDGRNKSGININGSRLVNERIDPKFRKTEFTRVGTYIDSLIKKLNNPNFKVSKGRDADIDGVITPTYGIGNRLTGADFVLNDRIKNKILGLENKFTTALGDHYGSVIERVKAPEWNTKAAEALDEIYTKNRATEEFTWLSDTAENADMAEIYSILPYEIKDYFKKKYGKADVPVQTKYLTGIVGYREISANKVDKHYYKNSDQLVKDLGSEAKAEEYLKLRNSFTGYLQHLFHSAPVAKAEYLARWLTRVGKLNVVVKGITTSVGNLTSNCVTLNLLGLSPSKACKYQADGLNELLKYKELKKEKAEILAKEVKGVLSDADRAKIRSIDSAMSNSIIGYMADKGGLPTVAEDISQPDRLLKDSIDRYFPKHLQGIAHAVFGDEKSWMLQTLTDLATFGDITARYAQFKYLTEDQKLDRDEAYRQCMQTFVDYSNPLPRSIQYFDSIGALPFTKFLLGNQTNIINSISKNPSGVLAWLAANSYMNVSDIYGSILGTDAITNRWKFPGFGLWYDSILSLPSMQILGKAVDIL